MIKEDHNHSCLIAIVEERNILNTIFCHELRAIWQKANDKMAVDFSQVQFMTAAACHVLYQFLNEVAGDKGDIVFFSVSETVKQMICREIPDFTEEYFADDKLQALRTLTET